MHIEHLEVFYYVCRAGGINKARLIMPEAASKSAISESLRTLEEQTNRKLFSREPGAELTMTPDGRELYAECRDFFDRFHQYRGQFTQPRERQLRIGASQFAMEHYVLDEVDKLLLTLGGGVRVTLRHGSAEQLEQWLKTGEIDVAIAAVDEPFKGFPHHVLMSLAPVLLVPTSSRIVDCAQLFAAQAIKEPLICPPMEEGVSRIFHRELRRLGLEWPCLFRADSTAMVPVIAARRKYIGLCLAVGKLVKRRGLRTVPLRGFPAAKLVAQWSPENSPTVQKFLQQIQAAAPKVAENIFA